jgi:hypothetical protein
MERGETRGTMADNKALLRKQLADYQEKLDLTRKLIRMEEIDPGGPEFIAYLDQQEARLKERIRTLQSQLEEQQKE